MSLKPVLGHSYKFRPPPIHIYILFPWDSSDNHELCCSLNEFKKSYYHKGTKNRITGKKKFKSNWSHGSQLSICLSCLGERASAPQMLLSSSLQRFQHHGELQSRRWTTAFKEIFSFLLSPKYLLSDNWSVCLEVKRECKSMCCLFNVFIIDK